MKTTHLIGLFSTPIKTGKIIQSFEVAKFSSDAISLHEIDKNVFAVSVFVNDQYDYRTVVNIFNFYSAAKVYETEHLMNTNDLKNLIHARSKAEIYSSPTIKKRTYLHEGMTSEVVGF